MTRTPTRICTLALAAVCNLASPTHAQTAASAAAGAAPLPALYELSVADAPAENGKRLNMGLREVERVADHSVVEVTFTSGGSVSSSLFVLRGMCGVMRARGEQAFWSEALAGGPKRYRVNFLPPAQPGTPAAPTGQKVLTQQDCALLGF